MNVLIVHFNTPELTAAAVKSVLKHTPDCKITVFDNSDKRPFIPIEGVRVIDNTKGQEINFDRVIKSFPHRRSSDNDYGSAKHCFTVDYCFKYFDDGFLLLDSDALVKRDISSLFDGSVFWVGQPHKSGKHVINIERLYPFCCYINTKKCKEKHIKYFNGDYMWQLSEDFIGSWYDTGAYFYDITKHLPHRIIRVTDYIEHYGNASFRKNNTEDWKKWLNKHKELYE